MSTKIGNVVEGNSYPNNIGVTPVKFAGKSAENAKVDSQIGNVAVDDIAKHFKASIKNQETAKGDVNKEALEDASEELSKVVQSMGANLTFSIHEGTQRLMVRMVDATNGTILKEFPPKDFLDMIARIRDYIGNLLDKKA